MKAIDKFNRFSKPVHNGQDNLKNLIFDSYPVIKTKNYQDLDQVYNSNISADYVWLVDEDVKIYDSFPWWFRPRSSDIVQIHEFPYVYKESRKVKQWDKVRLVPTTKVDTEPRQHIHICGEYDVYKGNEKFDVFYIGTNQADIDRLTQKVPHLQTVDSWYQAQQQSYTDMFWVIWEDVDVRNTFKFSYKPDEWSHDFVHVFGNGDIDQLDGIALFPKDYPITKKELEFRFYVNKKEVRIMASQPKKYEIFTVDTYEDYQYALEKSSMDMFWGVPSDVDICAEFNFDYYISYHKAKLKQKNHAWYNYNKFNGVVLYSKHSPVTKKEIDFRFISQRIEHTELASLPKPFDRFVIDTYDDYLEAKEKSTTHMFFGIPSDVIVNDQKDLDQYFWPHRELDTGTTHIFLNGEFYDGIALFSKSIDVSKKEIEHRFYTNKKEHDVVASNPKPYEKFVINNYNDYLKALKESKTDMFWSVPSDVNVRDDFNFDLYFSYHNTFDHNINHVFLNGENYDGISLLSKNCLATEKEIEHRFFVNKKEWDTVASTPKQFEKFVISDYDDYLAAREKSQTGMFWMIYPDIKIADDFNFDFYISHHNQYERKINHVWRNGEFYDGVALTSKSLMLTKHEIEYRFLAIKKENEQVASYPSLYDVVFISNGEDNADENYKKLLNVYPNAQRVDRVKGIHQAHIAAAKLVSTDMFWVVDADAELLEDFELDHQIAYYDIDGRKTVYVWRSLNPVNDLIYGYGGVKLLPTQLTLDMDTSKPDMTTSISKNFKGINRMSNVTAFNTDAFSAWRSGFRECVKLASRAIDRQKDDETTFRLKSWCSRGEDKPFGKETIAGAYQGALYGIANKNNQAALSKINDFEWLKQQFDKLYPPVSTEIDLSFLDKTDDDNIKEFNPIVKTIFDQIEKNLGKNYKFKKGSVKICINNVGNIYFDNNGVTISDRYADAEITADLKTTLKMLNSEIDTVELYRNNVVLIEGNTDLAREFQKDLRAQKDNIPSSDIALYAVSLSEKTQTGDLDLQIDIDNVGTLVIELGKIFTEDKNKDTRITTSKDIFVDILDNNITIVEALQEELIQVQGDILQIIELNGQLVNQEIHVSV